MLPICNLLCAALAHPRLFRGWDISEANETDLLEVRQIVSGLANRAVPGTKNVQPGAVRIKPIYESSVHHNLAAAILE